MQIDTCKVGKHLYQFTAIDDCTRNFTRMRVLALYCLGAPATPLTSWRIDSSKSFPFPFSASRVTEVASSSVRSFKILCARIASSFDPTDLGRLISMARSNAHNALTEFWSIVDNTAPRESLEEQLAQWQGFYNQERTHSAIHCKTPLARFQELIDVLPTFEAIQAAYVPPLKKYVTNNHYYCAMPDSL